MTDREFAYWLSGFIAISNTAEFNDEQAKYIRKTIKKELSGSSFGSSVEAVLDHPEALVKLLQAQLKTEEEVPQKANPFEGTTRRLRKGLRVFNEMLVPDVNDE